MPLLNKGQNNNNNSKAQFPVATEAASPGTAESAKTFIGPMLPPDHPAAASSVNGDNSEPVSMEMDDDQKEPRVPPLRSTSRGSSSSASNQQPMLIDERYRNLQMRAILHAQRQLAAKETGQMLTPSPPDPAMANYQLSAEEALAIATANQQHEQQQAALAAAAAAAGAVISAPERIALDRASELVQQRSDFQEHQQLVLQAQQAQAAAAIQQQQQQHQAVAAAQAVQVQQQLAAAVQQQQQQQQQAAAAQLLQQIQLQQHAALHAANQTLLLQSAGQPALAQTPGGGLVQFIQPTAQTAGGMPLIIQQPAVQQQPQVFALQLPGGGIQLVTLGQQPSAAAGLIQQQTALHTAAGGQLLLVPRIIRPTL